ncbi:MAG: hypothetical protein KAH99_00495 [Verrucomicrobia bacterium]|nr:hypothetical protein [Verrucomicrobiota bacterium]
MPKAPRTTTSRHSLPVFRNLLADMAPTGPNQAWVSDITYIRTDEGFLYNTRPPSILEIQDPGRDAKKT